MGAQLQKLNILIIKSCQIILGNSCLKWCSNQLLNKCQLTMIWHTISELGLVYIQKVKLNQTPTSIYEMYNTNDKPKRSKTFLIPKYTPKTRKLNNFIFYKFLELHNNLPDNIANLDLKKFKKQIKSYIYENYDPYAIPYTETTNSSNSDK